MGEKEISIKFGELSCLEIYCPCKAGVILDMDQENFRMPERCPSCNEAYSNEAKTALAAYLRFYNAAKNGKLNLQFRVKTP